MKKKQNEQPDKAQPGSKSKEWSEDDRNLLYAMKEKLSRIRKENNSVKIPKGYGGTIMQEASREGKTLNRVQVLMRIVDKVDEVLEENGDCPEEEEAAKKWTAKDNELHEVSQQAMRILQLRYKEILLEDEIALFYKKQGEQIKERPQADTDRVFLSDYLSMGEKEDNKELQNLMKDVQDLVKENESGKNQKQSKSKKVRFKKNTHNTPDKNENKQGKKISEPAKIKQFFQQEKIFHTVDLRGFTETALRKWIEKVEAALNRVDRRMGPVKEIEGKLTEAKELAEQIQANDDKHKQKKGRAVKKKKKDSDGDDNGNKKEKQLSPEEIRKREQESTLKKEQSKWNKALEHRSPEEISQLLDFLEDSRKSLENAERSVLEKEAELEDMDPGSDRDLAERYLRVLQKNATSIREGIAEKELDIACRSVSEEVIREHLNHLKERGEGIQKGGIIPESFYAGALMSNLERAIEAQSAVVEGRRQEKEKLQEELNTFRVNWDTQTKNLEKNLSIGTVYDASDLDDKREQEEGKYLDGLRAIEIEERKLAALQSQVRIAKQRYETALSWDPSPEPGTSENGDSVPEPDPDAALQKRNRNDNGSENSEEEKIFESTKNRLRDDFGIDSESLETIKGFEKLSEGQQLMVVENLRQITLGRVREEAEEKVEQKNENTIKKIGGIPGGRIMGSFWNYLSKHHRTATAEKNVAFEGLRGGMKRHGAILQMLVDGMKERGPQVEYDDIHDELHVAYLEADENCTEEERDAIRSFNTVANEFSQLPHEWGYDTASKKDQERFSGVRRRYEANMSIVRELAAARNDPTLVALLYDVRAKVEMSQLLNAHPEVENYLSDIKNQSALQQVFRKTLFSRPGQGGLSAISFGLGFARKSLVAGIVAAGAAPIVAGAAFVGAAGAGGYWLAKNRVREQNQKRSSNARRGKKDGSSESAEFISSVNLSQKLKRLSDLIRQDIVREDELTPEERKSFEGNIRSLRTRVQFTRQKLEEGRVDFGERNTRLARQAELTEALSYAASFSEVLGIRDRFQNSIRSEKDRVSGMLESHGESDERSQNFPAAAMISRDSTLPSQWNMVSGNSSSDSNKKTNQMDNNTEDRLSDFLNYRRERREKRARRQVIIGTGITAGAMTAGMIFREAADAGVFGNGEQIDESVLDEKQFFTPPEAETTEGVQEAGIAPEIGSEATADSSGVAVPEPEPASSISEAGQSGDVQWPSYSSHFSRMSGLAEKYADEASAVATEGGSVSEGLEGAAESVDVASASTLAASEAVRESSEAIPSSFTVEAEPGDGLTNLARKATGAYLEAAGNSELRDGLTAEHRVFIEDMLRRQIEVSGTLHPGDSVEISRDAIEGAIREAQGLTSEQLENLSPYADRVSAFDDLPRAGDVEPAEAPEVSNTQAPDTSAQPDEQAGGPVAESEAEVTASDLGLSTAVEGQDDLISSQLKGIPNGEETFTQIRESLSERLFGKGKWETYVNDSNQLSDFFDVLDNELASGAETSQIPSQELRFGQFIVAVYDNLHKHTGQTDMVKIDGLLLPGDKETVPSYLDRISFILTRNATSPDAILDTMKSVKAEKMIQFFGEKKLIGF